MDRKTKSRETAEMQLRPMRANADAVLMEIPFQRKRRRGYQGPAVGTQYQKRLTPRQGTQKDTSDITVLKVIEMYQKRESEWGWYCNTLLEEIERLRSMTSSRRREDEIHSADATEEKWTQTRTQAGGHWAYTRTQTGGHWPQETDDSGDWRRTPETSGNEEYEPNAAYGTYDGISDWYAAEGITPPSVSKGKRRQTAQV